MAIERFHANERSALIGSTCVPGKRRLKRPDLRSSLDYDRRFVDAPESYQ